MRIFGRILYATLVVGFFLLAFTYSRDLMTERYLDEVFEPSLTDPNSIYPKYYYFYSSIPDYHHSEEIFWIESNGYEIVGYEIAQVSIVNDTYVDVTESIYLIVYSDTEDLSQVDSLYLENQDTGESTLIYLQRFQTMNLINGVNETGYVYLDKDLFLDENIDRITLTDKNENKLVDEPFTANEEDFVIKEYMESFYDENNTLPDIDDFSDMATFNIYPNQTHIADDYVHIFYIAMGIYFVALILATYLIFFRKRKRQY